MLADSLILPLKPCPAASKLAALVLAGGETLSRVCEDPKRAKVPQQQLGHRRRMKLLVFMVYVVLKITLPHWGRPTPFAGAMPKVHTT
jgi:hypothetical protein